MSATPRTIEEAGRELVDRARHGDQNAIATIVCVRENAEKGSERAKRAHAYMMAYAKGQAPRVVDKPSQVSGDPIKRVKSRLKSIQTPRDYLMVVLEVPACRSLECAAELLSRGPKIGGDAIGLVGATFGSDPERMAYRYGMQGPPEGVKIALKSAKPQFQRAVRTGYVMGLAGRLQAAREGNIAAISRKAAWELT